MRYQVDLEELQATVSELDRLDRTVRSQLDRLDQTLATLHGTWSGASARAQADAHDRWKASAQEMHAALQRMRDAAAHAHESYDRAGRGNASMWRQLG